MVVGPSGGPSGLNRRLALCSASSASAARRAAISSMDLLPFCKSWRAKILFQRLHRLEQGDKAALAHGLDHQTVAVTVHNRFIARQLELHGEYEPAGCGHCEII